MWKIRSLRVSYNFDQIKGEKRLSKLCKKVNIFSNNFNDLEKGRLKNEKFNRYLKSEVSFLLRRFEDVEGIIGRKE